MKNWKAIQRAALFDKCKMVNNDKHNKNWSNILPEKMEKDNKMLLNCYKSVTNYKW